MTEGQRIAEQLRAAYSGPAWHGPSLMEALAGVTSGEASSRPIAGAHSIWEIVRHLTTGYRVVRSRLAGDRADVGDEEDWPVVEEPTEAGWREDLAVLKDLHETLVSAVGEVREERLELPVVANYSSTYRTLHGHVQHVLYHAGQIVLLRRAQESGPRSLEAPPSRV